MPTVLLVVSAHPQPTNQQQKFIPSVPADIVSKHNAVSYGTIIPHGNGAGKKPGGREVLWERYDENLICEFEDAVQWSWANHPLYGENNVFVCGGVQGYGEPADLAARPL